MALDPTSLHILHYPAPALRQRAHEVPEINDEVRAIGHRMVEMMFEAEGIGLAAPQVGLSWRLFVAHVPPDERRTQCPPEGEPVTATEQPTIYINPVLSGPQGPLVAYEEGCLSLPEITGDVYRPEVVTITARDLLGREFTTTAGGLLARCLQHEFDHLEGVLIIDRMTQISRLKMRSAVRRLEKARL
jgi:peptide deformylase